jgi:hypothetical protein
MRTNADWTLLVVGVLAVTALAVLLRLLGA